MRRNDVSGCGGRALQGAARSAALLLLEASAELLAVKWTL